MKNKAFSLIELLIVISLMGIVYGVYFFTKEQNTKNLKFELSTMKQYMKNTSLEYGDNLKLVYYLDKKTLYLIDNKYKVLDTIDFDEKVTQYLLKNNEELEVVRYKSLEIDGNYFEPTFIFEMINNEISTNMILNTAKNEWLYFDTYFSKSYNKFINEDELINFIKKKEYLPMFAGKPE